MQIVRILAIPVALCCSIQAQLTTSTVRGSATDPSGSAVADAKVTITNLGTDISRSVATNENGDFEIPDLPRGSYRLVAASAGFKNFVADNIILDSNQIRRIDVKFEIGAVGAEVTVRADAAVISTESAKIQASFTNQRFDDAPWVGDGRNPQVVMTTLPLVQSTSGIYGVQIAGQPNSQVQTAIDGVAGDGSSLQASNVHVMQEVQVVMGNNSAEYARAASVVMNTKSGANQLHGRAMYWHQNSALSARNFFETTKPKNLFHTMNAEISGPVFRNRTFFFFSWSGQRWPSSTFYRRDVPTERMRRGDFSQLLTLARPVAVRDPLSGSPFPGNVIPSSRLNPLALKVQQRYLPAPNLGGADTLASNYGFLFPYPTDLYRWDSYDIRIDHKISEKNTLYGKWLNSKPRYVLNGTFLDLTWTRIRKSMTAVIEDTHLFSPTLVNSFRFGLYRPDVIDGDEVDGFTPLRGDAVVKELGIQGVNPKGLSAMGFPRMDITGASTLRINPGGYIQKDKSWDIADSVTWAKSRHVLKLGVEFRPQSNFSGSVPEGTYGVFNFNGSLTGYGVADFILGLPFSSQRLDPLTNRTQLDSELGIYAQETFKVNSRLTLELGLRWDRFGKADYEDGLIYNWSRSSGDVIVPSDAVRSISPLYPKTLRIVTGDAQQHPSLRNFNPRIGVAYRPLGANFVIRGGYGIYTETIGRFARAQGAGPFQLSETFFNSVQNGQPVFAFPNPFPAGAGTIPSQSVSGFDPATKNGRIHQFNLTIERQFRDMGVRLSYLGSRSRGLNYSVSINKPEPSLIPFAQARRPFPQFVGASYAQNDGASNFNALTLQGQRRVGQLQFDAHWTWASNYANTLNLENPYAPLFWNRDASTVRHRVVLNTIWNLPFGKGKRFLTNVPGPVNHIAGGWQLYWIAYFETGQFFSPGFSGADPSNTNTVGGQPDRIANGNLPPSERTLNRWFDTGAFARPPAGRFCNSGLNVLEGPGLHLHDLTIGKTFPISERWKFTFLAAAQNLFNHANFNNPGANLSAPGTYGVITSTRGFAPGRQIMLRSRIEF
ncbi:MAG: TonB-dependent receptor [Acidobacteria bacterium]|nr:TonB-dependent receptor [Acidobacteriota bacterium]